MSEGAALALLAALSCGPADTTATSFGVGPGTTPAGSTGMAGSTGSTSSTGSTGPADGSASSTGGTSTGSSLDSSTGPELPPDFGLPGPKGCQGKIDFLFVISNSPTMKGHQPQVVSSLPEFITKIQAEFAEFDTHIMVTDTDKYWQMDECSVCGPGCDPGGEPPLCGAELDACDTATGAGVTFPGGSDSSARRCELAAGRYITADDPDPIAAFLCIAKVGSEGGTPRPADAMVAALSWPLLGTHGYPHGCNQGFLTPRRTDYGGAGAMVMPYLYRGFRLLAEDALESIAESRRLFADPLRISVLRRRLEEKLGARIPGHDRTLARGLVRLLAETDLGERVGHRYQLHLGDRQRLLSMLRANYEPTAPTTGRASPPTPEAAPPSSSPSSPRASASPEAASSPSSPRASASPEAASSPSSPQASVWASASPTGFSSISFTSVGEPPVGDLPPPGDHDPGVGELVVGWQSTLRRDGRPTYYQPRYARTDDDSPSQFPGVNPRGPPDS